MRGKVCGWAVVEARNAGKTYKELLAQFGCSRDELVAAYAAEKARRMEEALEGARNERRERQIEAERTAHGMICTRPSAEIA
jgi:uncharacterized protein (DUF433 family)